MPWDKPHGDPLNSTLLKAKACTRQSAGSDLEEKEKVDTPYQQGWMSILEKLVGADMSLLQEAVCSVSSNGAATCVFQTCPSSLAPCPILHTKPWSHKRTCSKAGVVTHMSKALDSILGTTGKERKN